MSVGTDGKQILVWLAGQGALAPLFDSHGCGGLFYNGLIVSASREESRPPAFARVCRTSDHPCLDRWISVLPRSPTCHASLAFLLLRALCRSRPHARVSAATYAAACARPSTGEGRRELHQRRSA